MTLYGGRRTNKTRDFGHHSPALHLLGNKLAHGLAHLVVVGTHKSGVFFAVGAAVEQYHRDALVVGFVDDLRQCGGLVGSHNKDIHALVDEIVDVLGLQFVIIVGRAYLQVDIVVGIVADGQFAILLMTPYILTALRYTHLISLVVRGASCKQQGEEQYQ